MVDKMIENMTIPISFNHFKFVLDAESEKAIRYQYFFSLLIVEMDQLGKSGFVPMLTEVISQTLRDSDLVGQDDPHRFFLILHSMEASDVCLVGERIRSRVERQRLTVRNGNDRRTVSIGGACFPTHATDPEELLMMANEMLQKAKLLGGNQVCLPKR